MTPPNYKQIHQTHPDLLRLSDHKDEISERIQKGDDPSNIELLIQKVEVVFQSSLDALRLQLAIQLYNQNPEVFSNFQDIAKYYPDFNSESLHNVANQSLFNSQLQSLRFGSPRVYAKLNQAAIGNNEHIKMLGRILDAFLVFSTDPSSEICKDYLDDEGFFVLEDGKMNTILEVCLGNTSCTTKEFEATTYKSKNGNPDFVETYKQTKLKVDEVVNIITIFIQNQNI